MARQDGVRTIKATPEGLYAIADRNGLATCVMVSWEEVPYDVRQHLVAVYRYMNEVNDKAIQEASVHVRDKKILHRDQTGWPDTWGEP